MLLLTGTARAQQEELCTRFAVRLEKELGLPVGLLHAMTLAETSKNGVPQPNAIQLDGEARYPASRKGAEALLRKADGTLVEEAHVGCMQLSLKTHARAFDRPESMLDPERNIRRAARVLQGQRKASPGWREALGRYHGGSAEGRAAYVCRVRSYLRALAPASATLIDGAQTCPPFRPVIAARNATYAHAVRAGTAP